MYTSRAKPSFLRKITKKNFFFFSSCFILDAICRSRRRHSNLHFFLGGTLYRYLSFKTLIKKKIKYCFVAFATNSVQMAPHVHKTQMAFFLLLFFARGHFLSFSLIKHMAFIDGNDALGVYFPCAVIVFTKVSFFIV